MYLEVIIFFNPIALRKTKIVYNFGLSECNRVKVNKDTSSGCLVVVWALQPFETVFQSILCCLTQREGGKREK